MAKDKHSHQLVPVRRIAIASQMALALVCVSSPLVITGTAWAQQEQTQNQTQINISRGTSLGGAIGQIAVPALIRSLQGNNSQLSPDSNSALGILGREAGAIAIPALIRTLQNRSAQNNPTNPAPENTTPNNPAPGASSNPAPENTTPNNPAPGTNNTNPDAALEEINQNPQASVPSLTEALRSPDSLVRLGAAFVLGTLGSGAQGAIPALVTSLQDPEQGVRLAAAVALNSIGLGLQATAKQLSSVELDQLISSFTSALNIVNNPSLGFPQGTSQSIQNPLEALQQERQSR